MSRSSVVDYFTSGINNTYDQTVNYWSKDGSIADAVDAVAWSAKNTDIVASATKKGFNKSVNELGTAVQQDTLKIIALVSAALYTWYHFKKGGK